MDVSFITIPGVAGHETLSYLYNFKVPTTLEDNHVKNVQMFDAIACLAV